MQKIFHIIFHTKELLASQSQTNNPFVKYKDYSSGNELDSLCIKCFICPRTGWTIYIISLPLLVYNKLFPMSTKNSH